MSDHRFKFGDPLTNVSAGDDNPHKHSFFVRRYVTKGRMNPGAWIVCTDKKGNFWDTAERSIVPGYAEPDELTAANARIAELEQSIKRQAAAALAGMNATKAVSSWEIQEARRLKAECSPASIASQREANEVLTNELQAATVRIAALEALLGEAPHSELCDSMASGWVAGLEVAPGDLDCNCFKSRVALEGGAA